MPITHRTRSNPGPEQSPLETKLRNAEWTLFQAKGFGASDEKLKPLQEQVAALRAQMDRPKVERKASGKPLERDTLRAIMELLHRHPLVAKAWRVNSGMAKYAGNNGKVRYVRSNTAVGMSDICGVMKNGKPIFLEVKSPTGVVMEHQKKFIAEMAKTGAVAGVCRSVEDAIKLLEGAK